MSKLFDTLEKIKNQPTLYIGSSSIHDLRLFIIGYRFAYSEIRTQAEPEETDFHKNFQPWLQKKFDILTAKSWDKIILFKASSEEAAFQEFFKLLHEFRQRDKQQDVDPLLLEKDSSELSEAAA